MKARLNQAIKMSLKPSLLLLGLLSTISILSCVAVAVLPIALLLKGLMVTTILLTTVYYILRDALLLLPWSWQTLEVNSGGELRLTNKRGLQFLPLLVATTFIHPLLVIINMSNPREGRGLFKSWMPPVVLFSDVLLTVHSNEQHRQLRVWLRWWKHDNLNENSHEATQY